MIEAIYNHPQPPDNERRMMSAETADRIMRAIPEAPIGDPGRLNALVACLGVPDRLDGWRVTQELTASLGGDYDLYWTDLNLLRPCLGNEHAAAVLDGNEIDYLPVFADRPMILQISRLTALLQDGGKSLSVAETGDNFSQSQYNMLVARNIIGSLDDRVFSEDPAMAAAAKKATELLVGADIIGGILQNHDVEEKLAAFQAEWPPELAVYRDDLLLMSYLSDASAHSSYRLIRNPRNGHIEPAVRPDDMQLTFLFERHKSGAVTLTPDRCRILLERLPDIRRTRFLLTGERSPYPREDEVFAEVVAQKIARHGEIRGIKEPSEHPYGEIVDSISIIEPDEGQPDVSVVRRFRHYSYQPDLHTDIREYLPGDGRIWRRIISSSSIEYYNHSLLAPTVMPNQYNHPNPEVSEMLRKIATTEAYLDDETIGRPLSTSEAWDVINNTENIL